MGQDGPGPENPEKGDHAGRAVGQVKGNPVAGLDPFLLQKTGETVHQAVDLPVGEGGPVIMDERPVRKPTGHGFQDLRQCFLRIFEGLGDAFVVGG